MDFKVWVWGNGVRLPLASWPRRALESGLSTGGVSGQDGGGVEAAGCCRSRAARDPQLGNGGRGVELQFFRVSSGRGQRQRHLWHGGIREHLRHVERFAHREFQHVTGGRGQDGQLLCRELLPQQPPATSSTASRASSPSMSASSRTSMPSSRRSWNTSPHGPAHFVFENGNDRVDFLVSLW